MLKNNLPKVSLLTLLIYISLLPFAYAENSKQSISADTEIMTVTHSRIAKSLDDDRTSDNVIIYPELISTPKRSVADIITQTPGVNVNGLGGLFQSYNIRGFSRARIKTEIDGIPIITDRRAGNSISYLPTELISSVYIQKGPQSTLYGSGAMGGVVSISTQSAESSSLGVMLQPQDNGQHLYARLDTNELNAGIVYRKANNAGSASGEKLNSHYQQMAGLLSTELTWQDIDIYASAIVSRGDNIGKSLITYPNKAISTYPLDNHLLSQIEFTKQEQWKFRLYQHNQHWQADTARLSDNLISRTNLTDYKSDTYGAYGSWLFNNTTLGLEWQSRQNIKINQREFDANNNLAFEKQVVNASENTLSGFILHDWYFNKLTLSFGARYDRIKLKQYDNNKTDSFFSASVNANYPLNNTTSIAFQLANAFRFPTVSELFFSGETPRGNTQGNSELAPEKSIGAQLSLKHKFNDSINMAFNAYHYDIKDYIERYKLNGVRTYRNNQKVNISGYEITSEWQISQQWQSALGFQWQQARDENNMPVDDSIPKTLKWALTWQQGDLSISQQFNYQLSKTDVGPSELPQTSHLVWNLTADYQVNSQFSLKTSLLNITNRLYKSSLDEDAAYQPERTLNISGLWHF